MTGRMKAGASTEDLPGWRAPSEPVLFLAEIETHPGTDFSKYKVNSMRADLVVRPEAR